MRTLHSTPRRERRALVRTACSLPVVYFAGSLDVRRAVLTEVGHGGLRLTTTRALIPGHYALVRAESPDGSVTELKARVVWSRYDHARRHFDNGLRLLHDQADTGARVAELVYDALDQNGATAPLYDEARASDLAWTA